MQFLTRIQKVHDAVGNWHQRAWFFQQIHQGYPLRKLEFPGNGKVKCGTLPRNKLCLQMAKGQEYPLALYRMEYVDFFTSLLALTFKININKVRRWMAVGLLAGLGVGL
jgi:hypothetical protein